MFTGFHISDQHIILIDIPVNAIGFEDFHLLNLFFRVAVPNLLGVIANRTIKDGMIIVRPKRKNVIGGEMLEGQFPGIRIIGVNPTKATVQASSHTYFRSR